MDLYHHQRCCRRCLRYPDQKLSRSLISTGSRFRDKTSVACGGGTELHYWNVTSTQENAMRKSQSSLQLSTLLLKKKNVSISSSLWNIYRSVFHPPITEISKVSGTSFRAQERHSFRHFSSKRKKKDDNVCAWCYLLTTGTWDVVQIIGTAVRVCHACLWGSSRETIVRVRKNQRDEGDRRKYCFPNRLRFEHLISPQRSTTKSFDRLMSSKFRPQIFCILNLLYDSIFRF